MRSRRELHWRLQRRVRNNISNLTDSAHAPRIYNETLPAPTSLNPKDMYISLTCIPIHSMSPVNGLNGATDTSNLNKSFLRGAQITSTDGVAQFETNFPGHYDGRATHLHIMSHLNATAQANGTIWDLTATHAGQLFFDQNLISAVEKTAPYTSNRQRLTANSADSILLQEMATSDPFLEYVSKPPVPMV